MRNDTACEKGMSCDWQDDLFQIKLSMALTRSVSMCEHEDDWIWLGDAATISDQLACAEFGLTKPELFAAIHAGKLQSRIAQSKYGPYLRFLRQEIEELVAEKREKGEPKPNTQLLELSLGEVNEVFVNVLANFAFEKQDVHWKNNLTAYHGQPRRLHRPLRLRLPRPPKTPWLRPENRPVRRCPKTCHPK